MKITNNSAGKLAQNLATLTLGAALLIFSAPMQAQTSEIADDFNRPDNASVGNGWSDACHCLGAPGLSLELSNGRAINNTTLPGQTGVTAGIYQPFSFDQNVTLNATIFASDGNPSAPLGGRFTHYFAFNNNGSFTVPNDSYLDNGYGISVLRSSNSGANSRVELFDNGVSLAQAPFPPFLLDSVAQLTATFTPDGQVIGTLANPTTGDVFNFSFAGPTLDNIASSGSNFMYVNGRTWLGSPRFQSLDDLSITSNNIAPIAVAGADVSVRTGDLVALDGSDSFDDNTPSVDLAYAWTIVDKPTGSNAALLNAGTATPSFVPDALGSYELVLTVTDELGLMSQSDSLIVSTENLAPTASAGNDVLATIGQSIQLDGSGSSDPETDPLSYQWQIVSAPIGSNTTIGTPGNVSASIVPDAVGDYTIELSVSDPIGPGQSDSIAITVVSVTDYAQIKVVEAANHIATLNRNDFVRRGLRNVLTRRLSRAAANIQNGRPLRAIAKLERVLRRSDGCSERGTPDTQRGRERDWIVQCSAQLPVYSLLSEALGVLTSQN